MASLGAYTSSDASETKNDILVSSGVSERDRAGASVTWWGSMNMKAEATKSSMRSSVSVSHTDREGVALKCRALSLSDAHDARTMAEMLEELEQRVMERSDMCGARFVMRQGNPFRAAWSILIVLLLIYTGTVFLYRLAFLEFRVKLPDDTSQFEPSRGWQIVDWVMTTAFWMDLCVNFFFSYEDEAGHEVQSLRAIVKHYLATHFIVDLLACLPDEAIFFVVSDVRGSSGSQGVKALRLQRMTRLARLMRLTRLAKFTKHLKGAWWNWFQRQRGFHVVNLTCGLTWAVHVLACGWYMCAALHNDTTETWVFRRNVNAEGDRVLADSPPLDQWAHAMYFTLTVFTTVGFGDMSAMTNGEIIYVCFMMLVGAVVHSIIITSVITVVTSSDQVHDFIHKNTKLVSAFAQHTEISSGAVHAMKSWVTMSAKYWITHQYNKDEMRDLIVGKIMPPGLLARLPSELFRGALIRNSFLSPSFTEMDLPPRLPLLLALVIQKANFAAGEIVFAVEEYAFSMFLVMSGTFAYIGKPELDGGHSKIMNKSPTDYSHDLSDFKLWSPFRLFSYGSYFGDIEVFQNCLRLATARCESPTGTVLIVHKTDLRHLLAEFPQFATKWRVEARRRDAAKIVQLSRLTQLQTYQELAANLICRFWRRCKSGAASVKPKGSARLVHVEKDIVRKISMQGAASVDAGYDRQTMQGIKATQDRLCNQVSELSCKVDLILQALSKAGALEHKPEPFKL